MDDFIPRNIAEKLDSLLSYFPIVGITGPRQCGKTTLVKEFTRKRRDKKYLYLDLEYDEDLAKLSNPVAFFNRYQDYCVIIDEIQRKPDLFPLFRSLIDRHRVPGRFIILGSSSPHLLRNSSETLAGRIAYIELTPFKLTELPGSISMNKHWLHGGFPLSILAPDNNTAAEWLRNFIRTYAERDIPMLGLPADPAIIKRLWKMIATSHGNIWNIETFARAMGLNGKTIKKYINFFEQAYLIHRLQPFHINIKKRLVKSPKIYIRDTGILHSLNGIDTLDNLLNNVLIGASWEGYVIEQVFSSLNEKTEAYFYRTHQGTECDLLLVKNNKPFACIEIKYTSSPKTTKSFSTAIKDLQTTRNYIIAYTESCFPLAENIEVVNADSFINNVLPGITN